jgi:ribonuclease HepT-like protein
MPSKSTGLQNRLFHIRDNIYLARTFVDGLDYEAFRNNQLVFYAVTRALEIISEASRRLPDDMQAGIRTFLGTRWPGPAMSTAMTTKMSVIASFGAPYIAGFPTC